MPGDRQWGQGQLSLDDRSGLSRSPLLRRLDAVVAPAARDAGVLVEDETAIDIARAVCAVMAEAEAGGLTRGQLLARLNGTWPRELVESRVDLFARLGLLQPYLAKAHQQRYVLNPAGMVGVLVIDRIGERGGVDELYVLLDRTRQLLDSGVASRTDVAEHLVSSRSMLSLYADELARLVDTAPLGELIDERRNHDHGRVLDDIGDLNALVSETFPDLDAEAYRLVLEAQRYVESCYALIDRILDEGGERRDFSVLSPEEYLSTARQGGIEALAQVGETVVWQHAEPWVEATAIEEACDARSRRPGAVARPPEPPAPAPHDDPIADLAERVTRERRRRELGAEQHLQGAGERELTAPLRGCSWEAAAVLLGDVLALDTDPEAGYHADTGDALLVDAEAPVTWASPLTLRADRPRPGPPATDAAADVNVDEHERTPDRTTEDADATP